jgi:hypothetical protein
MRMGIRRGEAARRVTRTRRLAAASVGRSRAPGSIASTAASVTAMNRTRGLHRRQALERVDGGLELGEDFIDRALEAFDRLFLAGEDGAELVDARIGSGE